MKKDSAKLQVRLWKYKSNLVLKDTDFDGLDDSIDKSQKDNHFTGRMHTTRLSGNNAIEVDMTMDYRYFFMSNKLYFDELSTMSLLYSNSIYRKGEGQTMHSGLQLRSANNFVNDNEPYTKDGIQNMNIDKFKNLPVKDMMTHFGFKDVKTYYMGARGDGTDNDPVDGSDYCKGKTDTHKGRVAIGYRNIEYHGLYKTVVGIVIRGTAEDDDWDSDFDMGDVRLYNMLQYNDPDISNEERQHSSMTYESGHNEHEKNYRNILGKLEKGILSYDKKYAQELLHFAGGYPDWTHKYHHAGFDIVANRIIEIIGEYMDKEHDMDGDICYWVTGHSMGAGVANIVAAELLHGESGINNRTDNVYCYTFAAPNTFYLTDNTNTRRNVAFPDKTVTETYRDPHGMKYRCIFNVVNEDDFVPKLHMEECEWTKYGRYLY